jgi:phosphatidylglycerol:prolipoprotein diacylglycerol transferase
MHPILFEFPNGFFLGSYGVLIALGLLACAFVARIIGRRRGMDTDHVFDLLFVAVASGFLGARLFYIVLNFSDFLERPLDLLLSRTGFVFQGGLITAVPACLWFVRRKGLQVWAVADVAAIAVPVAHAFGRVGCHFAGCCFGSQCRLPLAIRVPKVQHLDGTPVPNAWYDQHLKNVVPLEALWSQPIWPVQLIEAAGLAVLAGGLWWWHASGRRPVGILFAWYLLLYGALRFGVEFLRGDLERGIFFGGLLSTGQLISLGMIATGIWWWWQRRGATTEDIPAPPSGDAPAPHGGDPSRPPRRSRAAR